MTPDEITEWCEVIHASFHDDEIELLENIADWGFGKVANGFKVRLPPQSALDALQAFKEGREPE